MEHMPGCEDWKLGPIDEKPVYVKCAGPCGHQLESGQDEIIEFEDESFCSGCFETETAICIRCEHRDFKDTGTMTPKGFVCSCCQRRMEPSELSREICHAELEDMKDNG
jgi:hypothetical protein